MNLYMMDRYINMQVSICGWFGLVGLRQDLASSSEPLLVMR